MLSEQGFWQEKLTAQQMALAQLEQQNHELRESLHIASSHAQRCPHPYRKHSCRPSFKR